MNNDLISREALKKAFEDTVCIEPMPYAFVKQIIDNATPVEITDYDTGYQDGLEDGLNDIRPQGEWVVTLEDTEGIHHIKCPFCKYEKGSEFEPYIKVTFDKLPNFCEKCGAVMRKEEENEQTTD